MVISLISPRSFGKIFLLFREGVENIWNPDPEILTLPEALEIATQVNVVKVGHIYSYNTFPLSTL